MRFGWVKSKRILVLEAERGLASEHLEAAKSGQKGLSSAEWPAPYGVAANLATQDATFHLYTDRVRGMGRFVRTRKRVPLEIRDTCPQEDTTKYISAVIFVSATGDFVKAGALLDGFIQSLARDGFRNLYSVLFVITDALSLQKFRPPPIDPIDAWSMAKSNVQVPMAPAIIAGDRRNWFGALGLFDRRLGSRMDRLADVLNGANIGFDAYPVSQYGFRATTGECVVDTLNQTTVGTVSFNLFYLDRHIASTLPRNVIQSLTGPAT
jgi:hypothetical protein